MVGRPSVAFTNDLLTCRTELANTRADLVKWMFIFWVGTAVPLAGLIIAYLKR